MMSILLTIAILLSTVSGDSRIRSEYSWPSPAGVLNKTWQSNALAYYQRLRLTHDRWHAVLLTEKDIGEEWGDLLTGGISYSNPDKFSFAAGGLRLQFAHGLVLSHPGPWSGTNPLALSKSPKWRMRSEVSESPSANDANPFNGLSSVYNSGHYSLSAALGWSLIDSGSSGLHQTETDINNQDSITDKLAAIRIGYKFFGISFAYSEQEEDGTIQSSPRAGFDFNIETDESVLTGELALGSDSSANFIVAAGRGIPGFRHTLTLSRHTTDLPRSSEIFGSDHNLGAGYGIRWRPLNNFTIDAGALFFDREAEDLFKAALQFSERLPNRFILTERIKISTTSIETTTQAQITTVWSPFPDLTFSLKFPFAFYRSNEAADQNGGGVEIRFKHSPSQKIDFVVSMAAASTDGWNSRVYAYSLSFPGEFGSRPLYNSSRLLQSSISLHLSEEAILRIKASWFSMPGQDYLGSGDNETEGSSKTAAGIQLDWKF